MSERGNLERTRRSLYFAAGLLYLGGTGFLLLPSVMLDILFAEGIYSLVTLRMMGALTLAIAIVVSSVIEKKVEAIYVQFLYSRVPVMACLAYVYWDSLDRMWLIIFVFVLIGWIYTLVSLLLDRREAGKLPAPQP